jgi:hypothetical protein
MSPLRDAILDGDTEAVRRLVEEFPDSASGDKNLFWACDLDLPAIAALLLQAGANPNQSDDDGETALHVAAFEDRDECVRLLLAHGANPNVKTELGKTPLMNAAQASARMVAAFGSRSGAWRRRRRGPNTLALGRRSGAR